MGKPILSNEAFIIKKADLSKLKKDALLGSPEAALRISQFYDFIKLDDKAALYWVRISAENGHAVGQHNFAYSLMENESPSDRLRAMFWAKKSIANGNKEALDLLKEIEGE